MDRPWIGAPADERSVGTAVDEPWTGALVEERWIGMAKERWIGALAERWIGALAGGAAASRWAGAAVSERGAESPTRVAVPDVRAGSMADIASATGPGSSDRFGSLEDTAGAGEPFAECSIWSLVDMASSTGPVSGWIEDVEPAGWAGASEGAGAGPEVGTERAPDERWIRAPTAAR